MPPTNGTFDPTLEDQLRWSVELANRAKAAAASPFRKAVKYDAKLRLAISGPAGSGKSYTLLKLAAELGGTVAAIDTEHGSLSKYADQFTFDVEELTSFDPVIIPDRIQQAAAAGYRTLIIDSLSHFWNGVNGELEQVDRIAARSKSGNSFAAWREVSPKHARMVDAIVSAPLHILVGMRVKTQWIVQTNEKGKVEPRRVGLESVMREGIEYEFDVAADMDGEHNFLVQKTRCPALDGEIFHRPGAEVADILKQWLASPVVKPAAPAEDLTGMQQHFEAMRQRLGDEDYFAILGQNGYEHAEQIPSLAVGTPIYKQMILTHRRNQA